MDADKRHFYLRRLHSLSGVVPVGMFLVQHIYGNVLALWGGPTYDEHVNYLLEQPLLPLLEWGGVFLPLLFHAALGVYFMADSRLNPGRYSYARNITYTLQRVTAWVTLAYVAFHVFQTRVQFSEAQKADMFHSMLSLFQQNPGWLAVVYGIGVVCASFHLCNGLWTFCIVWGITVTKPAQKLAWKLFMGLFAALAIGGIASLLPLSGAIKPPFETKNHQRPPVVLPAESSYHAGG